MAHSVNEGNSGAWWYRRGVDAVVICLSETLFVVVFPSMPQKKEDHGGMGWRVKCGVAGSLKREEESDLFDTHVEGGGHTWKIAVFLIRPRRRRPH